MKETTMTETPADFIIAPGDCVDFPDALNVTTASGCVFDVPISSAVADSDDGQTRIVGEFRNGRCWFCFDAQGRYRVRLRNSIGQTLHEVVVWAMPRADLPTATASERAADR